MFGNIVCSTVEMGRTARWIIVMLVMVMGLGPIGGHEIIKFMVPPLADPRENANLVCHYDMESDQLYSAKWFKGDHEIFRYMPGQRPAGLLFPLSGIKLSRQPLCSPMACDLELTGISSETSGQYRCEVSTEAPLFKTVQKVANLTVAALPQRDPLVSGLSPRYMLGDEIKVNCTSDPSLPPAELIWYVNDREASFLNVKGPWETQVKGLTSRTLELRLMAEKGLFRDNGREGGTLKVQCISEVSLRVPSELHRRQTTVVTNLVLPPYLTNEKYAWLGNGGVTNTPLPTLLFVHLISYLLICRRLCLA